MPGMAEHLLLYSPVGSQDEAERIARALVEERLVACVNILSGMRSCYRWNDGIQFDDELVLIAKTRSDLAATATARLVALHSYDLPAVLQLPITGGHAPFLSWIDHETALR
jgi:periplasmic divalent cation tolerance protein